MNRFQNQGAGISTPSEQMICSVKSLRAYVLFLYAKGHGKSATVAVVLMGSLVLEAIHNDGIKMSTIEFLDRDCSGLTD